MKLRQKRLEAVKLLISSQDMSSHDDIMTALRRQGFSITQATLSRDLKLLKVAKAARLDGKYVYVLPNDAMYRRVSGESRPVALNEGNGFISITFSRNIGVIKTRNGYASALAFNIDEAKIPEILGTIAGADTVIMILAETASYSQVTEALKGVIGA